MKIIYKGSGELISEFGDLLTNEGLDVAYFTQGPAEQTSGAPAVQVFEVKMPGPVPEWATALASAQVAVSKFHGRYPDATTLIEFEGVRSDLNVPLAAENRS
jgi:hypothetical protein